MRNDYFQGRINIYQQDDFISRQPKKKSMRLNEREPKFQIKEKRIECYIEDL